MGVNNNKLALIILLFIAFSVFGNLFVWLKITGNLAIGRASAGYVGICIDRPPTIQAIPDQTATAKELFTYQVLATDSDNPIYYHGIPTPILPTTSTLETFFINRTSGLIDFTPELNEVGTYSVYIWACHHICSNNSNASTTFNLLVNLTKKAPYWINYTRNFSLTEDMLFTVNFSTFITEPNNETFNMTHNSTSVIFPSFGMSIIGLVNFTPNDSDVGVHWINITVTNIRNFMNSSIFNLTVININDAPILQAIPDLQTCEDSSFFYQANGTDEDLFLPRRKHQNSIMCLLSGRQCHNRQKQNLYFLQH